MTRLDKRWLPLFAALAVAVSTGAFNAGGKMIRKAAEAINAEGYRSQVQGLAADELEGREPGTRGEQKTAEYIEKEFLELGLQPAVGGDFRQDVELVEITGSQQQLSFAKGSGGLSLAYGDDMVVGTRRVQPSASVTGSEVVFVGYGINAPEYGWNDYAGVDMRGKTALILVNDPGFVTGEESLFRGRAMTYHGRWTYKFEEAARQGAAAAVIVHETAPASYDWGVVRNSWTGPQFHLDTPDGNAGRSALEGWITEARARQLMELAGQDFDSLKAAAVRRGFRAVPLGVTATGSVRNAVRRKRSPNFAGVMPGKDRPDEYVVYTAHWDHLGLAPGTEGDRVYNGAVDNATGVAGILMIARAFRDMLPGPSRSVLFLAVTAEESGLLGSEFYVAHPIVPLEKTAAVINIDALQPLGRAKDLEVVGFGASDLEDLLADAARSQGRSLVPDSRPEAGRYYRSDQFNFAKAGVPALYVKSGTTLRDEPAGTGRARLEEFQAARYHKPGDQYDESWDVAGSIEDLRLLFEVGARVANSESWPEWREGNEFRPVREKSAKARETKADD
ncbi:MAG TPA: M28 family metallopeptidase [Steroidobacteraceae bacterium]|jgi:Zn-dependent M28 family amino/carboxypeptidase|nr:M28 family metallopeptidase [Steroidobacteraceae bacterium]